MLNFEKKVLDTIISNNMLKSGDRVVVGVSGGADSVALLCVLKCFKSLDLTISVCHINHNIRGAEADRDEAFVRDLCNSLDVPLYVLSADVPAIARENKISEELAGRNVRYEFFEKIKNETNSDKIAVAQNKNDFAETIFLNITRGCNLNGLKGIKAVRGDIVRPLISTKRAEIEEYLNEIKMDYVTDSTNLENEYSRNIVRNLVFPALSKINPSIVDTVYKNSKYIEDDNDFIESYSCSVYKECVEISKDKIMLSTDKIANEHTSVKRRVILNAIKNLKGDVKNIESEHIDSILSLNKSGTKFTVQNLTVFFNYGILTFELKKEKSAEFSYEIVYEKSIEIESTGEKYLFELCSPAEMIKGKNIQYLSADALPENMKIRNRREGDRFNPYGMTGYKKLKDFFIDIKIPSQNRGNIPLLADENEIIAVLGHRISNKYAVTKDTNLILKITKEN